MTANLTHWLTFIKRLGAQNLADKVAEKSRAAGLRGAFGPLRVVKDKKRAYVPGEGCGAPTRTGTGIKFRDGTKMFRYSDGSLRHA